MAKSRRKSSKSEAPKKPTDGEIEILQVLWTREGATVREVFNDLAQRREVGYTTVLKLLQIMSAKGLVRRDAHVRPQIYYANRTRKQTQHQALGDLVERFFQGSPGKLVLQALSSERATPAELNEIRELLDRIEEKGAQEGGQ